MRTILWCLVVALIGVTIAYLALKPSAATPTDDESGSIRRNMPGQDFTVVEDQRGQRMLFEAEDCQAIEKPMAIKEGSEDVPAGASAGKCVYLGPEKINEKPDTRRRYKKSHPKATYPGFTAYVFTAPWTGKYDLWLRAYWVNDCGNSVLVSVDERSKSGSAKPVVHLAPLGGSTFERWTWNPLKKKGQTEWIQLEKNKEYTLFISNREDDVYFDQILLRSGDRTWPDPTGIEN